MTREELAARLTERHGERGAAFCRAVEPLICGTCRPADQDALDARFILARGSTVGFLDEVELILLGQRAPYLAPVLRRATKGVGRSRRASAADICAAAIADHADRSSALAFVYAPPRERMSSRERRVLAFGFAGLALQTFFAFACVAGTVLAAGVVGYAILGGLRFLKGLLT